MSTTRPMLDILVGCDNHLVRMRLHCGCPPQWHLPKCIRIQDNMLALWLSARNCHKLTLIQFLATFFTINFLGLGRFYVYLLNGWRILVIGRLDLKLSEKQAEQTLAAARLAAPPDVLCQPNSVGEELIFYVKLHYSVFLPFLIAMYVCSGEEEASTDNLAPSKNLLNVWILSCQRHKLNKR